MMLSYRLRDATRGAPRLLPVRPEPLPTEQLAGRRTLRPGQASWQLASATFACPACDVPVLPTAGGHAPSDPIACGWCGHGAPARDFLSLADPKRPAHVVVRVSLPLPRA